MMICDDCQGEMARDTVIFMIAVRKRETAMHQPGIRSDHRSYVP